MAPPYFSPLEQGGAPLMAIPFTLYARSYCHLCQDMLDALHLLASPAQPLTVEVIDIDAAANMALLARYDALVPVLFGSLAEPALCHYVLDAPQVRRYLAQKWCK